VGLRNALAIAELALTVVLLIAGGLLLRSYDNVLAIDPGFNPDNLLVAETLLPPSKYTTDEVRADFYAGAR
jgi:putative ABC transport system permease protein